VRYAAILGLEKKMPSVEERMYPILPCRDLDEAIAFYAALGFARTYRQLRPNPCAVVARGAIQIHLFGMPEFDPEQSYGSVIVVVPDPDALYRSFADGLRKAYGKLPVAGIPRLLRPRKRFGTVYGFSVVDVGGNWLRIYKMGDTEETVDETEKGLAKILEVAARLGDAHGDDAAALRTLENGLSRCTGAPMIERAKALLFRAELAVRLGKESLAQSSLSEVLEMKMRVTDLALLEQELAHTTELVLGFLKAPSVGRRGDVPKEDC
jgi:catechol 2,3-dioxygenase-like lactoylglutathione lyase family enzyme